MIYLVSTAGHPKYGDELIAKGWLEYLAKAQPDEEVWLDCHEPGSASVILAGIHPNVNFTNTLWRSVGDAPADADYAALEAHVTHRITHYGSPFYDLGLMKLRQAESIHLLGGGYVNSIWPGHVGLAIAAVTLKSLTGARLVMTGASLLPTDQPETLAEVFKNFDHVSVRDLGSSRILGIDNGLDDAFLVVQSELQRANQNQPAADLMICVQNDLIDDGAYKTGVSLAREAIARTRVNKGVIRYVEALPGSDRVAFNELSDVLNPEEFIPFAQLWTNGLRLAPHQKWITSRLHLHLMAAASGAKGTVIETNTNSGHEEHQSLLDLGTGWAVNEPLVASSEPSEFEAKLTERSREKLAEAQQLYPSKQPATAVVEQPKPQGLLGLFGRSR